MGGKEGKETQVEAEMEGEKGCFKERGEQDKGRMRREGRSRDIA